MFVIYYKSFILNLKYYFFGGGWHGTEWWAQIKSSAWIVSYLIHPVIPVSSFTYHGLPEPSLWSADHVSIEKGDRCLWETRQILAQRGTQRGKMVPPYLLPATRPAPTPQKFWRQFLIARVPWHAGGENVYLPYLARSLEAERVGHRGRDSTQPSGGWPAAIASHE